MTAFSLYMTVFSLYWNHFPSSFSAALWPAPNPVFKKSLTEIRKNPSLLFLMVEGNICQIFVSLQKRWSKVDLKRKLETKDPVMKSGCFLNARRDQIRGRKWVCWKKQKSSALVVESGSFFPADMPPDSKKPSGCHSG